MGEVKHTASSGWEPVGLVLDGDDWHPGDIGFIVKTDGNGVTIDDLRKAAAAPEMFEALKAAKRELWDTARHSWTLADFKNWAVVQQIDDALAKARGS